MDKTVISLPVERPRRHRHLQIQTGGTLTKRWERKIKKINAQASPKHIKSGIFTIFLPLKNVQADVCMGEK